MFRPGEHPSFSVALPLLRTWLLSAWFWCAKMRFSLKKQHCWDQRQGKTPCTQQKGLGSLWAGKDFLLSSLCPQMVPCLHLSEQLSREFPVLRAATNLGTSCCVCLLSLSPLWGHQWAMDPWTCSTHRWNRRPTAPHSAVTQVGDHTAHFISSPWDLSSSVPPPSTTAWILPVANGRTHTRCTGSSVGALDFTFLNWVVQRLFVRLSSSTGNIQSSVWAQEQPDYEQARNLLLWPTVRFWKQRMMSPFSTIHCNCGAVPSAAPIVSNGFQSAHHLPGLGFCSQSAG